MRILVVLIAGIGDLILASKSLRAIRHGFPDSEIHLLTSTDASSIAHQYAYLDKVWDFPIREMRKNKAVLLKMLAILHQLRRKRYGFIINLYPIASAAGAIQMGLLFSLLRAPVKIGHNKYGFGLFVHKKIPADMYENRHFADAFIDVARFAGGKPDNSGVEVFYDRTSEEKLQHLFARKTRKQNKYTIALNPGSDQPQKRIHPDRLAAVADKLAQESNARILLLGGPGETSLSRYIQDHMHHDVVNLAGKLSLNDLVYTISQIDLLITNDSAPMHVAAALNIKQVAIFGPGYPALFGPYTAKENYHLIYKDLACRPCSDKKCEHISCLENITADEVYKAASLLLGTESV